MIGEPGANTRACETIKRGPADKTKRNKSLVRQSIEVLRWEGVGDRAVIANENEFDNFRESVRKKAGSAIGPSLGTGRGRERKKKKKSIRGNWINRDKRHGYTTLNAR